MKFKNCIIENYKPGLYRFRKRINNINIQVYGKSIREIKEKYNKILSDIENGIYNIKKKITLEDYINEWLSVYKIGKVKETTILYYKNKLTRLYKSELIKKDINSISLRDINLFLSNIEKERLKNQIVEILKDIFNKAFINDLINKDLSKFLKVQKIKNEKVILNENDINLFINICNKLKYGNFFKFLLFTGMRKGEGLAINKNNIDLKNRLIKVDKTLNDLNKITSTKTCNVRYIPIHNMLYNLLVEEMKEDKEYLFLDIKEKPLYREFKDNIQSIWKGIKIHSLRHSFATLMNSKNINIKTLQFIMGHSDINTTMNIYTHINKKSMVECMSILNSAFSTLI